MPKQNTAPYTPKNHDVAILVYDNLCSFEYGIAFEVFGLSRHEFDQWYNCRICSVDGGSHLTDGGLEVRAPYGLEGLRGVGTIVIPGWAHMRAPISDELKAAIQREYNDGARIVSICSGAVVPSEMGLLDGKCATTHWMYSDQFRERCPNVCLKPDVLYVDEGQVLTSAGSAAGIDLGLYIIRHDFGAEAANIVARRMIVPPHRDGGQAQFINRPVPDEGGRLARVMDEVRGNLAANHDVDTLAKEAGMSVRTLHRRFQDATGMSPARWVAEERIKHAKDLLETTSLSVEQVSHHCGFGGAEVLRHHFRKSMGLSPQNYRRRFTRLTA